MHQQWPLADGTLRLEKQLHLKLKCTKFYFVIRSDQM